MYLYTHLKFDVKLLSPTLIYTRMSDQDSMVATRARRANAGSRLKQLIEIEEQNSGTRNIAYNEDDENVQLLFQEDENDEEFEAPVEEESEIEEGDEEENDEGPREVPDLKDQVESSDVEAHVNSDEMLSDSDLSASDEDESEGERELQKQEKAKKRKKQLSSIIPAIKKPKPSKVKPSPKPEVKHLELLLLSERRASARKSAIRNKQELVQRLKEDESRRAALAPVVRVKEKELSQEERLAQAKETERANIISLNQFMEQEIVKKERQKLLFQQRRPKLRNVIRLLSTESYVTPLDEVEDNRRVRDLFEKKKRGRRRKNISEEPETRSLGDIDTELPYYKKEMEEKRIREQQEEERRRQVEAARAERRKKLEEEREERKRKLEEERLARKKAKEERLKEFEDVDIDHEGGKPNISVDGEIDETMPQHEKDMAERGSRDEDDESGTTNNGELNEPNDEKTAHVLESELEENQRNHNDGTNAVETQKDERLIAKEPTHASTQTESAVSTDKEKYNTDTIPQVDGVDAETDSKVEVKSEELNDVSPQPGLEIKSEDSTRIHEKKVTFVEPDVTTEDLVEDSEKKVDDTESEMKATETPEEEIKTEVEEEEPDVFRSYPEYRKQADGTIFQGPVQHVARNLIFLLNFEEEERWGLTEMKMKTILFGEDANLGPSRRFREVETILKSSLRSDNPYATPKEEKEDELFIPVTELTEDSAMFEVLMKLPRLDTKEIFEEEEIDENMEESTEIRIRTEAPTGLYLPNGNKKLCLLSGKEVRYFDPFTGIPYENKDVYQIIKTIELGAIPWYSMSREQNTYGPVEIYLNNRENPRHAKGVPEGFDGF